MNRFWVIGCVLLTATVVNAGDDAVVRTGFIYESASFPQCHASTIVQTHDGQMVAAWFGGTREKNPDVGIWLSRLEKGKWTAPVEVANGIQYTKADGKPHRHPCWNPVLVADGNILKLFYKCGPSPSTWWGMLTTSQNRGKTWSIPGRLPEGIDGPVKNKPIRLADGSWLCGSSTEYDGWVVHFEIMRDGGRQWTRIGPINDGSEIGAIQPSILRLADGKLQALGRSRQGRIWTATSADQGKSWSKMELMDLPNPSAGTDAVTLADGRHVLVYNHTRRGRSPLNVAISKDGKNWMAAHVLENEPGEYSYPAVIQAQDGMIHITYTWKRQRIRHVVLDPSKLKLRPITNGQWPD